MRINTAAEDNIACAAVSPCGAWVACAHASRLSLYALREDQDGTLDIDKVLRPKTRRTPPRARAAYKDPPCSKEPHTQRTKNPPAPACRTTRRAAPPRGHLRAPLRR